jgi:hypothetical protein
MTDLSSLIADPAWLPERLDHRRGVLRFARMSRAALAREAFLDERAAPSAEARVEAPFDAVIAATKAGAAPRFIFHTAFCCSTLLARALDAPGHALALKEPAVSLDLADAMRVDQRYRGEYGARAARTIFALLARPHQGTEAVVVKPTNAASLLIGPAAAAGAPMILLYGSLRDFLISVLKKSEEARAFFRKQYLSFAMDGAGVAAIEPRQAMGFTDLQIAALVWRHQIEAFASACVSPAVRAATLDYRRLLADPPKVLAAAARHLQLTTPPEILGAAARGEIFARNAKFSDQRFDATQRDAEDATVEARWKKELDLIENWASALSLGVDAKLPLARPL